MSWLAYKALGYLPFTYLESLFAVLKQSPRIRFRTFADLDFNLEQPFRTEKQLKAAYKAEFKAWKKEVKSRDEPVIDIILMHDCDSGPKQTVHLCEHQAANGIVSTTALFTRTMVKGIETPYPIDYERLLATQARGNCFTYHCNAYQTAGFDASKVETHFNEDVAMLTRCGFAINHFSPHGGPAGPDGRRNNSFFYPAFASKALIWTHNRFSPIGDKYSDGGLASRLARGDLTVDLQYRLMKALALNTRFFILLHPQYYFSETPDRAKDVFAASPWVEAFWKWHEKGQPERYWEPLGEFLANVRHHSLWYKTRHKLWQGYNFIKALKPSKP
ncbi:MAG: hypothetical protein Q9M33_07330 [Robiginitomaculum sp.]|nr:hypothetical protein [Robiginitomaculum sp.]MDQ7077592.1 hypothetical protein [Robiginitomaculum sp.]